MAPLTNDLPKALLPFGPNAERPLLEGTLRMLADWGVRQVLVNAHHLGDQVMAYLVERASHPPDGLQLAISYEPTILGTGGALAKAGWFLDDQPTWLVNADVVAELDPTPLIRHHRKQRPFATLWMHAGAGPRTVRLDEGDGHTVTNFADPQPGSLGTATFCGLHLMDRRAIAFLQDPPVFESVIDAYRAAQKAGHAIHGLTLPDARWADVGTPEQYLDALFGEQGNIAIATDAHAGKTARKHAQRVAVWSGATLTAKARPAHVIVGRGTHLDGPAERIAVPARMAIAPELLDELPPWCPEATAVCLSPRGSDRRFIRLQRAERSAILMQHGTARPENERFANHAAFLHQHGIDVPEIILSLPKHRACLVENLGQDELLANPSRKRLRDAVDLMRRLHDLKPPRDIALEPPFTLALLRGEHDLFLREFVDRHHPLPARKRTQIKAELDAQAKRLARLPRVLLHRDLQSTNIIFHDRIPHFIDFQGMRLGPAAYDVASLLADPYMHLDAEPQQALLEHYAGGDGQLPHFYSACVQRLVQALGAYGRLGAHPRTRRFLRHIPPALQQLQRALTVESRLPALGAFIEIARKSVSSLDPRGYPP